MGQITVLKAYCSLCLVYVKVQELNNICSRFFGLRIIGEESPFLVSLYLDNEQNTDLQF